MYRSSTEKPSIDNSAENDATKADVAVLDTQHKQDKHKQSTQLSTACDTAIVGNNTEFLSQTRLKSSESTGQKKTALQRCVTEELNKYFATLDGHPPRDLYRMVVSQVEAAVIDYALDICDNNQSRAATYLGISRGKLRSRLKDLDT